MKINFNQVLVNLKGEPLKQSEDEDATLGSVAVEALLAKKDATGKDKANRYDLAMRIHNSEEPLDFKIKEMALIQKLIGDVWPPLVVGQAWKMLEKEED